MRYKTGVDLDSSKIILCCNFMDIFSEVWQHSEEKIPVSDGEKDFWHNFKPASVWNYFLTTDIPNWLRPICNSIGDYPEFRTHNVYNENIHIPASIKSMGDKLKYIQHLIADNKFKFPTNMKRIENRCFKKEFKLNHTRIKQLVMQITEKDFSNSKRNKNKGHEDEFMYIFAPALSLSNGRIHKWVRLYVKFCIVKDKMGDDMVIIVSCHRRKHEMERPFASLYNYLNFETNKVINKKIA